MSAQTRKEQGRGDGVLEEEIWGGGGGAGLCIMPVLRHKALIFQAAG